MCQSSVWTLYPDGQKEKIAENASYAGRWACTSLPIFACNKKKCHC